MHTTDDDDSGAFMPCPPTQEDIAERAQELWECYGRPAGRDAEIRIQAERQLLGIEPLVNPSAAARAERREETPAQNPPCLDLGAAAARAA